MAATPQATITLKYPFDHDGKTYSQLVLRIPRVGDQLDLIDPDNSPQKNEIALLSHLCDISTDAIRLLALSDYAKLQAAFVNFSQDSL